MKIFTRVAVCLFLLSPLALYAIDLQNLAKQNAGKKMAIVSLSANNYNNALKGWAEATGSELMSGKMNVMLEIVENLFGQEWSIVKASTFMANPDYQALAGIKLPVGLPSYSGASMPLFSKDRGEMIKAKIDPALITKICDIAGVDFAMVIYSEWYVKTGLIIPTTKALTKNVISIYDRTGKEVFSGRTDVPGAKTLGAYNAVVVDENSIDEWVDSFEKGLNKFYNTGRRK